MYDPHPPAHTYSLPPTARRFNHTPKLNTRTFTVAVQKYTEFYKHFQEAFFQAVLDMF
jgi:hypothetical protein